MFNRKVIIASSLLAPLLTISAPASAASLFQGLGSSTIINGNGAFFDTAIPNGNFNDRIEFVTGQGVADVGVLYFELVSGITDLQAAFNGTPITFTNIMGDLYSGGITAAVRPGTQTITVSGISSGPSSSYSGTVKFAAVPEAGTWLMMIAGLGFAGFALRRRRIRYSVNYAF